MRKFLFAAALVVIANSAAFAGSIGDWQTAGTLVQGDKTYTFISVTGDVANMQNFTSATTALNGGVYTLQNANLANIGANSVLRYEVSITTGGNTFDQWQFNQSGILGNGGASTSTDTIYSDAFMTQIGQVTLAGSQSSGGTFGSGLTNIWVEQAYNGITPTLSIGSVSLDVTQKGVPPMVPEPSTFALLGLGALGLAVRALRRRQAAV